MLKLDNTLLDELGLGSLPEDQKRAMLQHIYETLELRVGTNLANQMSDQQLDEFEKFIDDGGDANQAQALQWLETNLPNYKQVVNEVFEALKLEIKAMAPQLLSASATAPQQAPSAAMPGAPQSIPGQPAPMPYAQPTPAAPASAWAAPPASTPTAWNAAPAPAPTAWQPAPSAPPTNWQQPAAPSAPTMDTQAAASPAPTTDYSATPPQAQPPAPQTNWQTPAQPAQPSSGQPMQFDASGFPTAQPPAGPGPQPPQPPAGQ
ncbi:MAG TPA: DUF5663 domain-containing protein [Candidatus Saccharimonadales bacterium]|nr:DUF5663 domain-containing protein [Candidatus Saccharimonadales bacterium]